MTCIQELNKPETPKPDVKIWRYMEVERLIENYHNRNHPLSERQHVPRQP